MKNPMQVSGGGAANKTPIRNPLEEILEIGKKAVEQTGVTPVGPEQQQMAPQPEAPLPQPSLLEKRKDRIIMANKAEIEQMISNKRHQRERVEQQEEMVEEQQQVQLKQKEKKSKFQIGLDMVKKRAMHKVEGVKQKAA